jgi:curved DNA-binding protein CbpA
MADPLHILGVTASAGPDEIRRKYLELVRQHPPDREPERFAQIRAAYDELSDPIEQLKKLIFDVESVDSIDAIIVDLHERLRQRRIPTEALLSMAKD